MVLSFVVCTGFIVLVLFWGYSAGILSLYPITWGSDGDHGKIMGPTAGGQSLNSGCNHKTHADSLDPGTWLLSKEFGVLSNIFLGKI